MGRLVSLFLLISLSLGCSQDKIYEPVVATSFENQTFTAKVIRIIDGDTMEVLYEQTPVKIRLAHIDCPEKRGKQPFGNNAKVALSDLCFGQLVTVQGENYDRYKRLIAVVINDKKQIVNQEMVKQGMAWHFTRYSKAAIYDELETEARQNKVGLWQEPNPTPPWSWRKNNKL
ncbi:MAG: thermonuclease family protein [Pedobacter sp.]|nr:MAG: thermonuclease family protein [Pedobacter sp.]